MQLKTIDKIIYFIISSLFIIVFLKLEFILYFFISNGTPLIFYILLVNVVIYSVILLSYFSKRLPVSNELYPVF